MFSLNCAADFMTLLKTTVYEPWKINYPPSTTACSCGLLFIKSRSCLKMFQEDKLGMNLGAEPRNRGTVCEFIEDFLWFFFFFRDLDSGLPRQDFPRFRHRRVWQRTFMGSPRGTAEECFSVHSLCSKELFYVELCGPLCFLLSRMLIRFRLNEGTYWSETVRAANSK